MNQSNQSTKSVKIKPITSIKSIKHRTRGPLCMHAIPARTVCPYSMCVCRGPYLPQKDAGVVDTLRHLCRSTTTSSTRLQSGVAKLLFSKKALGRFPEDEEIHAAIAAAR